MSPDDAAPPLKARPWRTALNATAIALACGLLAGYVGHSDSATAPLGWTAAVVGVAALVATWRAAPRARAGLAVLAAAALLTALLCAWNAQYRPFVRDLQKRKQPINEVFRRNLWKPATPAYVRPQGPDARVVAALAGGVVLTGAGIALIARRGGTVQWAGLVLLTASGAACFALADKPSGATDDPHRWAGNVASYGGLSGFAAEAKRYDGPRDVLARYVHDMPSLSWMSRHYPPGNILVFEALGTGHGAKIATLLLVALAALPTAALARALGHDDGRAAAMLLAASPAALVFPTVNPIGVIVLGTATLAWLVAAGVNGKRWAGPAAGAATFAFALFSFGVTVVGLALALFALLALAARRDARSAVWLVFGGLTTLTLGWALFKVLFGFDLVACFVVARHQHEVQQAVSPFLPRDKWLFRSTGNALAYAYNNAPLVALAVGALVATARRRRLPTTTRTPDAFLFAVAVAVAYAVASAGGLFWLETERIWVFFTPLLAAVAAAAGRDARFGAWALLAWTATFELVGRPYL